jgi:hypothetical protein
VSAAPVTVSPTVQRWLRRLVSRRPEDVSASKVNAPPAPTFAIVARRTATESREGKRRNGLATAEESTLLGAVADELADAIWADFIGSN